MKGSRQRCAILLGVLLAVASARGQVATPAPPIVRSFSGQFVVTAAPEFSRLLHRPDVAANTNFVRLEPALLAVAAERFKSSLWGSLGLKPAAAWTGKIFLVLRPARSLDDEVYITATASPQGWNYRLELPDVLSCRRYARALATALLAELAHRHRPAAADQAAEIPPWLAAGLAQQTLADDGAKIILSSPANKVDNLAQSRLTNTVSRLDPLAGAWRTLQRTPALTFAQLSWPSGEQLEGNDGGVYLASAQLFVQELLSLKNGAAKCRDLLARLPGCRNWQSAFLAAFHQDFSRPLDVEKWWAIRVVAHATHDSGPRWPAAVSRVRLAELLNVPVAFRSDSNSLPMAATVSLQLALKNFNPEPRDTVLRTKQRDLQLAEFRLAPPFNTLAAGYRFALEDFLGEHRKVVRSAPTSYFPTIERRAASVAETVQQLDQLDASRRAAEAKFDALQQSLNPGGR